MPDYYEVPVTEKYHSDLFPQGEQDRVKTGYVAVKRTDWTNSFEAARGVVQVSIAAQQFSRRQITWEDERWTGRNGWKRVTNSLTVL